jgi:hypothetical protein
MAFLDLKSDLNDSRAQAKKLKLRLTGLFLIAMAITSLLVGFNF